MGTAGTKGRWARAAIAAAALAAAALLTGVYGRAASERAPIDFAPAAAREDATTVTVVELAAVELARKLTLNGSIHAWQEVVISPEVGGYRVAEVHVDVGDRVTRGQPLVQLSTALLAAEAATRHAALKQREAELENAEAELERGAALASTGVLSEADFDRLRGAALAARAQHESALAELETSRLRLELASVTAPDDGVISSRTVTVGEVAQAGGEMLRLLRHDRIEWRGEVPEASLGDLHAGQPVTVTAPDGTPLAGTIRTVAPTLAAPSRTGVVYVDLVRDERIRPGMFARGEIEIGRGPCLTVPLRSLITVDGYQHVFVLRGDGTVERRHVRIGNVLDGAVEIVGGLRAGETVVDKGAPFLRDGDFVNVVG